MSQSAAPGAPGLEPTWCSSDKDLVGTAVGPARLWFTLGHGIVNEVYHPRIDIPQIRDLGIIVADGKGFWVELKRLQTHEMYLPAPGIPLPTIVHRHPRFVLSLRVSPDPERDVLLIDLELEGDPDLRPYVLLAPRLGGSGLENCAWSAMQRGRRVLWAEQGPFGLALSAATPDFGDAYGRTSVGYVGASDLWQDFSANGRMRWEYRSAGPGNVALAGELGRRARLALGISTSKEAAATLAVASLTQSFDTLFDSQTEAWAAWHREREQKAPAPRLPDDLAAQYRTSAMVLKCHRDKVFGGAMVASLSVPWGNSGEERGGYHLVWPRDLVESATALLALGGEPEARNVLRYLIATQNADGRWFQNQWLGGKPYWSGIQLDESAFPVLLAAALAERNALDEIPVRDMVARALGFVVREGPASPQDRWEEDAGVNTFTLAACIAALVSGAGFLGEADAELVLTVADYWNSRLEDWTFVSGTELARRQGVSGYYVRVAPAEVLNEESALSRVLTIKNRDDDGADAPASEQVALDFLQLVRLGLRGAEHPWIRDSLRVADELLRSDTPQGPVWHRYTGDGYGEHADGSAFDGTGIGRGWPLLTGERGHYALASGQDPQPYLRAMNAMAGRNGMLPEQVWDTEPVPERQLYPGRPSGSAMPLAWTHAEFVKLAVSSDLGRPFDRLETVWRHYAGQRPVANTWVWTSGAPLNWVPAGRDLLLLFADPVCLHWGVDGWQEARDTYSHPVGLGLNGVRLMASDTARYRSVEFTWRGQDEEHWSDEAFRIDIVPA
jgi:glucoamylase